MGTGQIIPATFKDKGPDMALRSARHFTGSHDVGILTLMLLLANIAKIRSCKKTEK